jgi:hypothetical protein
MATTDVLTSKRAAARDEDFEYRPVSTSAVASAVFGLLSISVVLLSRDGIDSSLVMVLPLPIIGAVLGLRALGHMRANPDQFTGAHLAKAGVALSAVCLVGGVGFSAYVHATEAPEGYARTSFVDLRPDEVDLRGNHAIPPEIAKLDGQKVFIKGYIRPDSTRYRENIGQFLLVRDNNQCCFGDLSNVKYFDQVAVAMKGPLRVNYRSGLFRIGGTLRVFPENAREMAGGPAYALEADYAK